MADRNEKEILSSSADDVRDPVDVIAGLSLPKAHSQKCPVWIGRKREVSVTECNCWIRSNAERVVTALAAAGKVVVDAEKLRRLVGAADDAQACMDGAAIGDTEATERELDAFAELIEATRPFARAALAATTGCTGECDPDTGAFKHGSACPDRVAATTGTPEIKTEPDVTIDTSGLPTTSGMAIVARGATRKNGAAKILKAQGWYWLSPIRQYVTREQPLADAAAKAADALRAAGLTVEIVPASTEETGGDE